MQSKGLLFLNTFKRFAFCALLQDRKKHVKGSKITSMSTSETLSVRVVGEKEAFSAVNVSCFPSKDLTCLDLLGLTAFASVAWFCGRFLAGSFALKVCWLTGVGFSQKGV